MTRPSKSLPPLPRLLWNDTAFVFNLKLPPWMLLYIGSPSTLIRKGIRDNGLMYVAFYMVMVLNNHLFYQSLRACVDSVRNWRQKFRFKHFWEADLRCHCWNNWVGNLSSLMCIEMCKTEGVFNSNTNERITLLNL